ncbi:hypothetical protein SAMN06265339_0690 [Desulfurobacterium pacificum]|jgi:hypothetical protein|uniref:Uncharacterized protein n=1 Tax=Desulfurobacterium pacificum TaxID=240166 RepID=A0ABY1NHB1_9BACT|nr:hypothetical protein [Desulfurobacterium pacificum]SMP09073.1 hypothetical protein SAMN06265339_0690 [Desulfurobacterium pacificum]
MKSDKRKKEKKFVQTTIRVRREILKEYKKWLIDNGYRSINQHINEVIRKILERDNRLPPSTRSENSSREKP